MRELPIKLISTDFDGTLFAEFENPPIPVRLTERLGELQQHGVKWVINTGRDMPSLLESLARARLPIQPDYLVLVEREIHRHDGARYVAVEPWNQACHRDHEALFAALAPEVPALMDWVNANFEATVYADAWSPFCLMAGTNGDADHIMERVHEFCRRFPDLTVMRNDVYARFSHVKYDKGSALAELGRLEGITPPQVFAAGDHLNDLPMLRSGRARYLVAPANAVPMVKTQVADQGGYVSPLVCGNGVLDGLEHWLRLAGR
jgi:HAD superfamily hydrolase (TIGR01484 family)